MAAKPKLPSLTDGEYRKQRDRVRAAFRKWSSALGLGRWRIDLHYDREFFSSEKNEAPMSCIAYTKVQWEYMQASITFSMQKVYDLNDEELDYTLRHELGHVLINQMREWQAYDTDSADLAMKHEEIVTTNLGLSFGFIWEAAFKAGRKAARK